METISSLPFSQMPTPVHILTPNFLDPFKPFTFHKNLFDLIFDLIYLLTAMGLSPGGSSTVHIYTQTIQYNT